MGGFLFLHDMFWKAIHSFHIEAAYKETTLPVSASSLA
jgi:hypothetical protein